MASKRLSEKTDVQGKGRILFKTPNFRRNRALPTSALRNSSAPPALLNPFRFLSKYQDDEPDLMFYGHRYYSPFAGRFINREPIEGQGRMNNILYLILLIAMYHSYGYCGDSSLLSSKDAISQKRKTASNQNDIILYDDLEWLVGKWRCVAKYPLTTNTSKISKAGELSQLIVYLPYSDSDITLELHEDPLRTITAELLLSSGVLDPCYPFMIGINTITIGAPSAFALEFHYSHSFNESKGIEILELSYIDFRFVFEKASSDPGDIYKKRAPGIVPDPITLRRDNYDYQVKKYQLLNRKGVTP